jgi:hypothetical protein
MQTRGRHREKVIQELSLKHGSEQKVSLSEGEEK